MDKTSMVTRSRLVILFLTFYSFLIPFIILIVDTLRTFLEREVGILFPILPLLTMHRAALGKSPSYQSLTLDDLARMQESVRTMQRMTS